jgi:peptidoglycan/LPS O-acetylase OafA/YrhL
MTLMLSRKRLPELDVLRAIAIILVLGRHLFHRPQDLDPFVGKFLILWFKIGWVGVDLFFVLSGFLISGLLFSEHKALGKIDIEKFYIRRAFKLLPPFYLLTILSLITSFFFSFPRPLRLSYALGEIFFVQNYAEYMWQHTWSLAVEEHFYILIALLLPFLLRRSSVHSNPFAKIPKIAISTAALILVGRILTVTFGEFSMDEYKLTHFRMDALLFGVLLSYYYHYHHESLKHFVRKGRWALFGACLMFILIPAHFIVMNSDFLHTFGFTLVYLGAGAVLLCSLFKSNTTWPSFWNNGFLHSIGIASYSIYLWHLPIYNGTKRILESTYAGDHKFLILALTYLGGSYLAGRLTFLFVERPILRLRQRLFATNLNETRPS